jgi:uncharacterized protein YabE (DUF348 family)
MTKMPAGPARFLKTRYIVAALVAAVLVVATVTGFVWAKKDSVALVVDGQITQYKTEATDVAALLDAAGVEVADGDLVNPPLDAPVSDGDTVTVRHAVPVTLELGEDSLELSVIGSTVADVLVSAGLDPESGLSVEPAIDTPLAAGMTIKAADVFLRVVEEEVEIPFESRIENDSEMAYGAREIETAGVPGRMLRIYEVVVTDGTEGARVLRAERVLEQPVDEVILVGTKRVVQRMPVSRGSEREIPQAPSAGTRLTVSTSAYTAGVGCGYHTATGAKAVYGVAAVDPAVIPLGTRFYVPGYGYAVAADTGGAINGNRVDLCFDTLAEAKAWGRRTVTVTIAD